MASKKRVLIVDDDEIVQKLIAKLCERQGADVTVAASAKEVAEALDSGIADIDLFFVDLILPDISGWEILNRIRANDAATEKPVIVLTGALLSEDEKTKILGRANSIIEKKNFSLAVFDEVLKKWL